MMVPKSNGDNNVPAIVLLTVVGAGIGAMAAAPFVPGSPFLPIVGPIAASPPVPWRADEATSISIAYQNAGDTFASAAPSGAASVRPRGALGTVPRGTAALNGVTRNGSRIG